MSFMPMPRASKMMHIFCVSLAAQASHGHRRFAAYLSVNSIANR